MKNIACHEMIFCIFLHYRLQGTKKEHSMRGTCCSSWNAQLTLNSYLQQVDDPGSNINLFIFPSQVVLREFSLLCKIFPYKRHKALVFFICSRGYSKIAGFAMNFTNFLQVNFLVQRGL